MYIVTGEEAASIVGDKYLLLELDTIRYSKDAAPVRSFCVIDSEHVPLTDINRIAEYSNLHENLIKEYKKRNWKFCIDALEHLKGIFRGELDSFYDDIEKRCIKFQQSEPPADWDYIYDRTV